MLAELPDRDRHGISLLKRGRLSRFVWMKNYSRASRCQRRAGHAALR
jgi:hypothetical protein